MSFAIVVRGDEKHWPGILSSAISEKAASVDVFEHDFAGFAFKRSYVLFNVNNVLECVLTEKRGPERKCQGKV